VRGRLLYHKTRVVKNEQTAERVCTVATKTAVTMTVQQLKLEIKRDAEIETHLLNIKVK
jgi:hypothetical protein